MTKWPIYVISSSFYAPSIRQQQGMVLSHQLSIQTKHTRVHTHTHNRHNLTCHWELHNCNQLLALSERVIAPAAWSYLIKMSSSWYDYMAQSTQMKISSPYPCTIHQLLYSKQWSIRVKMHVIFLSVNYLHMVGFIYFLVSKYSMSRLSLPVWCYYDQIMIKNKVFTVQWQSRTQTNLDLWSLLLTHKKALIVSSTRYAKDCIRKRVYPSHSRTSEEGMLLFMHSKM